VVRHALEVRVVVEDLVEDVEEEPERKLVEVIHGAQLLEDEEIRAACLRKRQVFGRHGLNLAHHNVRVLDLARNLSCFALERLECVDNFVIVEDIARRLVQRLK
jgi:hypothetical protein